MEKEIPKTYEYQELQKRIFQRWIDENAFDAIPDQRDKRYVIMMPLPNVTGALHMGHAMDNIMQDLLVRWHRMKGYNALWQPGTDHAGIATQAVVEKRLFELEKKTRHDIGREALVARIWEWKDQYQQRIIGQLKQMGCSCDWKRQRFTMDDVCTRAVRETFFKMFADRLIYRGNRLVNWDCQLRTAVSDDEINYELVQGHFWHLKYPIIDPKPGEPEFVSVATTRPETMLGDTAVACHPDPDGALDERIQKLQEKFKTANRTDRATIEQEIETLKLRKQSHLPVLRQFAVMAREGRKVRLPLQNREIPLITDQWAKPELGSGCVKITPGHDPNDYMVWQRHQDEIDIINILNQDGTLNENAGAYAGVDRFEARKKVVADLKAEKLLEKVEEREIEIGHSDRSKTPIEPYLSKQWFVKMGDVDGGIVCGRGTPNEFTAPGLAQAAIDAVKGDWTSKTGRKLTFYPDSARYSGTYYDWLVEKRDWCISRQLWWGHRIPIWRQQINGEQAQSVLKQACQILDVDQNQNTWLSINDADGNFLTVDQALMLTTTQPEQELDILICLRTAKHDAQYGPKLENIGFIQDPDVLDTWFSSALWPHSTLGWPDPDSAVTEPGQTKLGKAENQPDSVSYYYPGTCLVTARDIITLWVARMVLTGLYNLGDVPFTDSFIHANILDGKGERMSKSKGNGIDPVDIIEQYGADALRYVICDLQTGTQDIRLPVQAVSPFTGNLVDLATAKHGRSIFTYLCPESGKEFDVLGTMPDLPAAKVISDRFEVGKHFCNKLWNASRFALLNLETQDYRSLNVSQLESEDQWILSRLTSTIAEVEKTLKAYNPSAALNAGRKFFWNEFCDWYLELIKPRFKDPEKAIVCRQILASVLDQILRLLHPFTPYITEAIWEQFSQIMPKRGIETPFDSPQLIAKALWPTPNEHWQNEKLEQDILLMQEVIREIRNVRSKHNVPPGKRIKASVKADAKSVDILKPFCDHMINSSNLSEIDIAIDAKPSKSAVITMVGEIEIYVEDVLDPEKEKTRLTAQKKKLQKEYDTLHKKLNNENFLKSAPEQVIEKNKQKFNDICTQLETIDKNLANLSA